MNRLIQKTVGFIKYLYSVKNISLTEHKMCVDVMNLPLDYLEEEADFILSTKED